MAKGLERGVLAPLYRLPQLLATTGTVVVVEGEKCAEAVVQAWPERTATCWPGGAGNGSWKRADWRPLANRTVQLIADADEPGRRTMRELGQHLAGLGCAVREYLPDGDDGRDIVDWIAEDGAAVAQDRVWAGLVEVEVRSAPHSPAPGDNGALDAKRIALSLAGEWRATAAHTVGIGWFVRAAVESIWSEDLNGVCVRNRIRQAITDPTGPAKATTKTHEVERELRDELDAAADRWDTDGNVLGLPHGRVWDVAAGRSREAGAGEWVSKRLGATPEPDEPATWLRHLHEVFAASNQREQLIEWLRWWLRYSLGVSCDDESFLFFAGPPGTGKSTIAETWIAAVGDYGTVRSGDRLAGDRPDHKQWLAGLHGKRVVLVGELPSGGRWDTANINALVSGEILEANRMRQNSMTFRSVSKPLITGNHRPTAPAGSGLWRRQRLLECRTRPEVPDNQRRARLEHEHGRILSWALSGGLDRPAVPETVEAAVAQYRVEADRLGAWLEERVEIDADAYETVRATWDSYSQYCMDAKAEPVSHQQFGREMTERFGASVVTKPGGKPTRVRLGLRLAL